MKESLFATLVILLLIPYQASNASDFDLEPYWQHSYLVNSGINPDEIMLLGRSAFRLPRGYSPRYNTESSFIETGLHAGINPAFFKSGLYAAYQPVLPVKLSLNYDLYYYPGLLGGLLSYESADSDYGDKVIEKRDDELERSILQRFSSELTITGKIDNWIIRTTFHTAFWLGQSERNYFHEWEYDTLIRTKSIFTANNISFLYEYNISNKFTIMTGPGYEFTYAWASRLTRQRLILNNILVFDTDYQLLHEPFIYLLPAFNIKDPNRSEEFTLRIGFGANLDF